MNLSPGNHDLVIKWRNPSSVSQPVNYWLAMGGASYSIEATLPPGESETKWTFPFEAGRVFRPVSLRVFIDSREVLTRTLEDITSKGCLPNIYYVGRNRLAESLAHFEKSSIDSMDASTRRSFEAGWEIVGESPWPAPPSIQTVEQYRFPEGWFLLTPPGVQLGEQGVYKTKDVDTVRYYIWRASYSPVSGGSWNFEAIPEIEMFFVVCGAYPD